VGFVGATNLGNAFTNEGLRHNELWLATRCRLRLFESLSAVRVRLGFSLPWRRGLRECLYACRSSQENREAWAFISAKFLTDSIWRWYLYLLPLFFVQNFHLDIKKFGPPFVTIYLIAVHR